MVQELQESFMITVIVQYEGSAKENKLAIGKVLSAINTAKLKKLVAEGEARTKVTRRTS